LDEDKSIKLEIEGIKRRLTAIELRLERIEALVTVSRPHGQYKTRTETGQPKLDKKTRDQVARI